MYINWAHYYVPKFSGACSVLINILFIWIVHDDRKVKLGGYRFLLIFFALYNFASTAIDLLVPSCVLDYKYSFSYFIVDGYFVKKSQIGTFFVGLRCCIISAAYSILHCHFVYRYMLLFCRKILDKYFIPNGLLLSVAYCLIIMSLWFPDAYYFAEADEERRNYMAPIFKEIFDQNVHDLNIVICLYNEASLKVIRNSYAGILIASVISIYSVLICSIFGSIITIKLRSSELLLSDKTKHLQKQLIKALAVQSTIPMIVCFCPCFAAWYLPVFNISSGNWIYWTSSVALSFFPVLDPLALFYFIPVFRYRVKEIFRIGAYHPSAHYIARVSNYA